MIKIIEELIKRENYTRAKEIIDIEIGKNIFDERMYFYLGNIYEAKCEYNRAYLCYEHAVSIGMDLEYKGFAEAKIDELLKGYNIGVKKVSIVILTYNNLDYTKICIDSIKRYGDLNNFEIIVVDNNSTDGTDEWLLEQKDIKVILNEKNEGFPKGCNQGIEISEKENDIFLLNNDTVVMPNSIFNLRMALYSNEDIGATGSVSNKVTNFQQISETFNEFDEYMNYALKNNITDEDRYEKRLKLVGFAFLVKRKVLDEIGLLDERFTPGNYEDDDLSFRILNSGHKLLVCKDSYIHHFGSVSFSMDREAYQKILDTNLRKFKEKWGFNSSYSCNIRYDLMNYMEHKKDDAINVLEIGCASGATLLEIENRYPNSNLYGIEIDEHAAKMASNVANVIVGNIENIELKYEKGFFDYIILGDVLEHLVNPKEVLEMLKEYLKDDGNVLMSIPNVMHYSVIYGLINGNWKYEDSGILDRTHLRFFTHAEIKNMCNEAEYYIKEISGIYSDAIDESKEIVSRLMDISGLTVSDQYYIIQYLLKINKKEFFNNVSYVIRKLELELDTEESVNELVTMIETGKINENIIIDAINEESINKIRVLNLVSKICLEHNLMDMIIPLLNAALEIDKEDVETNCNMAYILSLVGEKELALIYLYNIKNEDERVRELKERIGIDIVKY